MKCLIKHIGLLCTPVSGARYGHVLQYSDCRVLIEDGVIREIAGDSEPYPEADTVIDARGLTMLPGFVDAHTHPVFHKTREDEFIMRVQGKSYEEIAAAGGGIRNSVRAFRNADKAEIKGLTRSRIARFFEYGTTTIEAKSGYGLSMEDEGKSLEIIAELNSEYDLEMVPTFLGAHEIPDEYRSDREAYLAILINEMIPAVAEQKLARFCDVFCEKGVFTIEESRRILRAARDNGLVPKLHADELYPFGGAELAAEIRAVSADHLVNISDRGIRELAAMRVVPVLLPGTTFFLGKETYAPARKLIAAGCNVAVSTDYNPGSSTTQNLQLMWTLATLKMGMLPEELLSATTLAAAAAIQMEDRIGSVEVGKQADLQLLDIPNLNYLPYHYGMNHTKMTIKKGAVVYKAPDTHHHK